MRFTQWKPQPMPSILSRADWNARTPSSTMALRGTGYYLIFHHTAWNFSNTSYDDCASEIRKVQDYHMDNNGWSDIGYHYIIDPAGRVWKGRSDSYDGAHTLSYNNNIGIVVLGDFEGLWGIGANTLTNATYDTMCAISKYLAYRDNLDFPIAYNHKDFNTTECPGNNMEYYVWDDLRGHLHTFMEEAN